MSKIFNKIIILFLLLVLTSCSYTPIFSEKKYNFEIDEISFVGEKEINRIISNKIELIQNTDDVTKKKYIIDINSSKQKKILSNDSKGDPSKFEMIILVEYKIISNEVILLDKKIEKSNVYNNVTDQFKLEQTEDLILENLSENIGDIIISSIINLDDN